MKGKIILPISLIVILAAMLYLEDRAARKETPDFQNITLVDDCDGLEEQIESMIERANYCRTDSDCVVYKKVWCPFGCYRLINKNVDTTIMDEGLQKYFENCTECLYDCPGPPETRDVKCVDGKCVDARFNR